MSDTLLTEKILTGENVLRAAIARIEWIFETFAYYREGDR